MNWRLALSLSVFGLAMAIGTVYFIPSTIEPFIWLVIFIVCAAIIARRAPGRPFVHGLVTGIANSVWITAAHIALFDSYIATHAQEAEMVKSAPLSPRLMMLVTGPVIGVISGAILGLFAHRGGEDATSSVPGHD